MPTFIGGCHCGAVRFEVEGELEGLEACNCSLCARAGYLQWYVESAAFRLLTGDEMLRDYQFGTRTSHNLFCKICGMAPFRRPRSDPDRVAVNVRCLEGVDLEQLAVRSFDGRNWEVAMAEREAPGPAWALAPLAPAELEQVVRLWQRTKLDTPPWCDLATERGYSFEENLRFFRDVLVPRCEVEVAHAPGGHPVGFLAQSGPQIEQLFVDIGWQGQGMGSALLLHARQRSPEHLTLYTLERNTHARRFYERHGFRATKFGMSPAPESTPDVLYEWRSATPR